MVTHQAERHGVGDRWRGGWRIEALARTSALEQWTHAMIKPKTGEESQLLVRLREARLHALNRDHAVMTWLRGAEIEHVWTILHEVEEALVLEAPDETAWKTKITNLAHEHESEVPATNTVRTAFDANVTAGNVMNRPAADLIHVAHERSATRNRYLRSIRNRLLLASAVTFAFWVSLVAIQALVSSSTSFITNPAGSSLGSWQLVVLALIAGSVGGALIALPLLALRPSGRYDLQMPRVLLRIALGGIASFLGVLLLSSGWIITGKFTSMATLIVVAVTFGVAQNQLTKAFEMRAADMLGSLSTGNKARAPAESGDAEDFEGS